MIAELRTNTGTALYPRTNDVRAPNGSATFQSYIDGVINNFLKQTRPIGSILQTATAANPSTYIPGTTWEAISGGKVLVSMGTSTRTETATVNNTFGTYGVKLTIDNLPNHRHGLGSSGTKFASGSSGRDAGGVAGTTFKTVAFGQSAETIEPIDITEPVLAKYIWRRIS